MSDRTLRCHNALKSFAHLLVCKARQGGCYVKLPENFDLTRVEDESHSVVAWTRLHRTLLGRANIIFRCDTFCRTFDFHQPVSSCIVGFDADTPELTREFKYALQSYIGYHDIEGSFVRETIYSCVNHTSYGIPGDGCRDAETSINQIINVESLECSVFAILKSHHVDFSEAMNPDDIAQHLLEFVRGNSCPRAPGDVRDGVLQRIESRFIHLREAFRSFSRLKARVDLLVRQRAERNERYLEDASDDTLASLALHLQPEAARNLLQTCKRFKSVSELNERRPHFRIREVVACFPHYMAVSRDRLDVQAGIDRPVMRNFVVADKPIRIYIDYVSLERRTVPLKKKERTDGLSNRERDLDDDVYETPPEVVERQPPPVASSQHGRPSATQEEARRIARRREAEWKLLSGPHEKVHADHFSRRINFPADGIVLRVHLVFSDTHEPVPCDIYPTALVPSAKLRANNGVFFEEKNGTHTLPASCKVHVPRYHTSMFHANRLFKLCVTITGPNPNNFQRLHSSPFEVVSKFDVVRNAQQRRPPKCHKPPRDSNDDTSKSRKKDIKAESSRTFPKEGIDAST